MILIFKFYYVYGNIMRTSDPKYRKYMLALMGVCAAIIVIVNMPKWI